MKKTILLLLLWFSIPFIIMAQKVELTPFGGFVFAGNMHTDYGEVHLRENAQYGGMISIPISRVMDVDLIYNRSDTKAELSYYTIGNHLRYLDVPLSINYMHVGFTRNFHLNPKVSPFVGFNLGACLFAPKDYPDDWFFSLGLQAGAKIYFSKRVGLRLQAQGMVPVQGAGLSMFIGSGGPSGGVSVYSTLFQFGFNGGLIFRLGKM